MRNVGSVILAFFPSFIHVNIRRLLGQKIGKGAKIKFGTLILSRKIEIGARSKIGPFAIVKSKDLRVGEDSIIKSLAFVISRKIRIDSYVHIAPLCIIKGGFGMNSSFEISDHSRIFPFCWIDCAEGVKIGNNVGIGGFSLLFTHGVWSNFVDGGPVSFKPIEIGNNVWLPWRVFILPGVKIGNNVIVGANSLINKSIDDNSLTAGSPAKHIRYLEETNPKEKRARFIEILNEYAKQLNFEHDSTNCVVENHQLHFNDYNLSIDDSSGLKRGDLLVSLSVESEDQMKELRNKEISIFDYSTLTIHLNKPHKFTKEFVPFLRKFGVRLYENK